MLDFYNLDLLSQKFYMSDSRNVTNLDAMKATRILRMVKPMNDM